MKKYIFLSTPISNYINKHTGIMNSKIGMRIHWAFEKLGRKDIFLAIDLENWGRTSITAQECVIRDFEAMKQADYVVVLIFDVVSEGVLIELVEGLPYISDCEIHRINWGSKEEKIDSIFFHIIEKIEYHYEASNTKRRF